MAFVEIDRLNGVMRVIYPTNESVKKIKEIFIPYYNELDSYLLLMAYVYGNGATFKKVRE